MSIRITLIYLLLFFSTNISAMVFHTNHDKNTINFCAQNFHASINITIDSSFLSGSTIYNCYYNREGYYVIKTSLGNFTVTDRNIQRGNTGGIKVTLTNPSGEVLKKWSIFKDQSPLNTICTKMQECLPDGTYDIKAAVPFIEPPQNPYFDSIIAALPDQRVLNKDIPCRVNIKYILLNTKKKYSIRVLTKEAKNWIQTAFSLLEKETINDFFSYLYKIEITSTGKKNLATWYKYWKQRNKKQLTIKIKNIHT